MENVIIKTWFNKQVTFLNSTMPFIYATPIAQQFGKLLGNWLKTDETQAYISALAKALNKEIDEIVLIKKGGKPQEQGTWLHPKLAIFFARWLSPDFAVWCDIQIEDILKSKQQTPETAHQTVQTQNETLDLDFYTQQSEKIFKLVQLINSQNIKTLYFADNLYKNLNIRSPLELLKIDLSNYYFIPTELGNFINSFSNRNKQNSRIKRFAN